MHDYRKYDRSYILLMPETGGYALNGKKLSGTAILEIRSGKGTVTINIQGIKPPGASVYKLYLICSGDTGTTGVCIGEFIPDAKGKIVKKWGFDPENIGGSSLEYSDFNVVAVIVKNAELSNEIIAPLVGYKNGAVIWKSGFKEFTKSKQVQSAQSEVEPDTAVYEADNTAVLEMEESGLSPIVLTDSIAQEDNGEPEDTCTPENTDAAEYAKTEDEQNTEPQENTEAAECSISEKKEEDILFDEICKRLVNMPSHRDLGSVHNLHIRLKATVPLDKYEKLLSATVMIVDYSNDDSIEQMLLLLTEALGATPHIPHEDRNPINELLFYIDELVPGKVGEAIAEACHNILPHLQDEEFSKVYYVLKNAAEFFGTVTHAEAIEAEENELIETPELLFHKLDAYTEAENDYGKADGNENDAVCEEKVKLKSGLTGEYTMREPVPGEDHNARFRECVKNFKDGFNQASPEGIETADNTYHEKSGGIEDLGLNGLFEKRQQLFPFHGPHEGRGEKGYISPPGPPIQPGFPPAVPPVIPIYDIKWIKITPEDIWLLPKKLWKYSENPFVIRAYRKHRHLILGVAKHGGDSRYYFGVPGTYSERERLMAFSLGFISFLPTGGGSPRHGESGYWVTNA